MRNDALENAARLLEGKTSLTGPQARGCIRLGLKDGGLDAKDVTHRELAAVFKVLMPKRLAAQGISPEQAETICAEIQMELGQVQSTAAPMAAASMFDRLDKARGA